MLYNSLFKPNSFPNKLFVDFGFGPPSTRDQIANYNVMETDYENYSVGKLIVFFFIEISFHKKSESLKDMQKILITRFSFILLFFAKTRFVGRFLSEWKCKNFDDTQFLIFKYSWI